MNKVIFLLKKDTTTFQLRSRGNLSTQASKTICFLTSSSPPWPPPRDKQSEDAQMVFPGTCREMLLAPAPLLSVSGSENLETPSSQGVWGHGGVNCFQLRTACVSQNLGRAYASHFCFPSPQQRAQHTLSAQEGTCHGKMDVWLEWASGWWVGKQMGRWVVDRWTGRWMDG